MSADFDRLREVFLAALEQAPDRRDTYLKQVCGGDAELRRQVALMLKAHAAGDGPLDRGALRDGQQGAEDHAAEAAGSVIGPYQLLEPIGEGGMGTVWRAQQSEPVKRQVALKLIKAGMGSKQVILRFEAERQALALMDHPNIARVLDAGTTGSGRPYFVMDLVQGVPITRYCDEQHLTPRQRLELFVPVCQAVQHAHQKGIIHRDLKPSNVLVALYDGKPVPKVIDFGVAKATGQSLTETTLVTGLGALVGTLEYMSPEQAEVNQLDIDTRSDIYSLGVLLYELLAGSPPFTRRELEQAGMLEMLRVIREQEPTRPSTKLSTAEGLPALAANRSTEPAKLRKLVRGELDWIVMKALEKDRDRRYETASAFAADVQRYLHNEPVQACPPSALYRLGKFCKRNKMAVTAVAVFAGLLVAVAVGATVAALMIDQARQAESQARGQAQAAYKQADADRQLAEQRKEEIRDGLEKLQAATSWIVRGRDFADAGQWPRAEAAFSEAVRLRPDHPQAWLERGDFYLRFGVWDRAAADYAEGYRHEDPATPRQWLVHALLRVYVGDNEGYRQLCRRVSKRFPVTGSDVNAYRIELIQSCTLAPAPDADLAWVVQLASQGVARLNGAPSLYNHNALGLAHFRAGDYLRAAEAFEKSLGYTLSLGPDGRVGDQIGLALTYNRLGKRSEALKKLAEAGETIDKWSQGLMDAAVGWIHNGWHDLFRCRLLYREAWQELKGTAPPEDWRLLIARSRALMALNDEEGAAAARARAEALGAGDDVRAWVSRINSHFNVQPIQWDLAEAEYLLALKSLPGEPEIRVRGGTMYNQRGHWDKAITAFTEAIELQAGRPTASVLVNAYSGRAAAFHASGKHQEAIADHSKVLELLPPDHMAQRVRLHRDRGTLNFYVGDYTAAVADLQQYMELGVKETVPGSKNIDWEGPHLGEALLRAGRNAEAEKAFTGAIERHAKVTCFLWWRAQVYIQQRQHAKAIADFTKVIETDPKYQRSLARRGAAYLALGQPEKAVADCTRAFALDPKDPYPMALWNRAEAYDQLGQVDQAIADFTKAAEIGGVPGKVLELGTAHLMNRHYATAVAYFSLSIKFAPELTLGWERRADTYFQQREYAKAVADYTKVIEPALGGSSSAARSAGRSWRWATSTATSGSSRTSRDESQCMGSP
jgi:serine/threonine protein kinase/Tfp pilus assembly protein PilF